jgi:DNA-binding SARP family transcriptional activator
VQVRILGELEVLDANARPIPVDGKRQRALLALLATSPSRALPTEPLIDELWADRPPANGPNAVQTVVSRLRQAIGTDHVLTRPGGYELAVDGANIDSVRFEQLADEGRRALAAGDPELAGTKLRAALGLWRGAPLAEFTDSDFARREAARLGDRRLAALEDRIDADLALGRHADVVEELGALAAEHDRRERLIAQHLLALYRCGRQAEALARYRAVAAALIEEGDAPGRGLRDLERQMLRQDPALDPPAATGGVTGTEARGGADVPVRRLVSVVYVELGELRGAAAELDPERLRAANGHIFAALGRAMELHGGVVERLPGDDAVATFGLHRSHEDDAGRAVRAAAAVVPAVATAVAALGGEPLAAPAARVGVASGELVAGADPVTGADIVRSARALARAAAPCEVLVDAVTVDLTPPGQAEYELAGGGDPAAPARFRLCAPPGELPSARPLGTAAFVNRQRECLVLDRALDAAIVERRARVVTVLGAAGIGKSRLVREFALSAADRAGLAAGRCLSYGEGTSVFALAEVVKDMVGDDVRAGLAARLATVERAEMIAARVAAAVGAGAQGGPAEEIQWAVRRLLERVAGDRPLVVVLDDVHWAEPWLLDLVEYLAAFAAAPILVVACARPDLLDLRPEWARPGVPGELVELESLSAAHTRELVTGLLAGRSAPAGAAEHIASRSDGNPLFAEQVVALEVARDFAASGALPRTLRSLLQQRIDSLAPDEREVLARAAVEGVVFHRSALAALADDQPDAGETAAAMALMRKGFITTAQPELPGEDAFRFHHVLLRDAAYEALPKERRARMHVRYADWMERGYPDFHELIGHHLREAWRALGDLGADAAARAALGGRAAAELVLAADFASLRSALPAAAGLLRQAAEMLPKRSRERVHVMVGLGDVLLTSGRLEETEQTLAEAVEIARAIGDAHGAAHAAVLGLQVALQVDPDPALAQIPAVSSRAARTFRRRHDDLGMCRVHHTRALAHWFAGRCEAAGAAWVHAADAARASGAGSALPDMLAWVASSAQLGPEPVPTAIERCLRIRDETGDHPLWQAFVQRPLAHLYAMRGEFDRSRATFAECRQVLDEMSETIHSAARDREAEAALLEGDAERAERLLRESVRRLREMGDRFMLSFSASVLARSVEAQGRSDEAHELTLAAAGLAVDGDILAQVSWRVVRARILTERGEAAAGERIAREAVAFAASTDWLVGRADAAWTLGGTLRAQDRAAEADRACAEALALYERKEATVMLEACRAELGSGHARKIVLMPHVN